MKEIGRIRERLDNFERSLEWTVKYIEEPFECYVCSIRNFLSNF
jgi:hypothetical protein